MEEGRRDGGREGGWRKGGGMEEGRRDGGKMEEGGREEGQREGGSRCCSSSCVVGAFSSCRYRVGSSSCSRSVSPLSYVHGIGVWCGRRVAWRGRRLRVVVV